MKSFIILLVSASMALADVPVPRPATQAEANAGVLTTPYISPATLPGGVAAAGGVTNGASPTVTFFTSQTNYYLSPMSVYGATTHAFLNSTNWQVYLGAGYTNTVYVEQPGGTNFFYVDVNATNSNANDTFVFASTLLSPDGVTGIFDVDQGSHTDIHAYNSFIWDQDPGMKVAFSNVLAVVLTNFGVTPNGVVIQQPNTQMSNGLSIVQVQSPQGIPLASIDTEAATVGRISTWGGAYATPGYMYNVFRLFGYDRNLIGLKNDARQVILTGKAVDSTSTNGGALLIEVRRRDNTGGALVPSSGTFANPILFDNDGNTLIGNNGDQADSGKLWGGVAWLQLKSSSTAVKPQLLFEGSTPFIGTTNGAMWSDGTNVWVYENGVGKPIAQQPTIIQTNWIDGKFYTNNFGTSITVAAPIKWTTAGVVGDVCEALWIVASPTVGGSTNYVAAQTIVTSLAQTFTNSPCVGFIPTNAAFCWTNLSAGAGDSAAVMPGQIKYP